MKQLAYITQGTSEYDDRLWEILDTSGIDPHEFIGLDYFALTPFFVLAGATVAPDVHAHDGDVHVTGVHIVIEDDLEEGFLAAIPQILDDAYAEEDEDEGDDGAAEAARLN